MRPLVFLLEEPSAKDALEGFLPTILPENAEITYLVFEGKQDLERRMARTMRAWQKADARFVVMRDQDSGDCKLIKQGLLARCREAGSADRAVVRIACRELESWFLGDWAAVGQAFNLPRLAAMGGKAIYRDPDRLGSPVAELRKVIPTYQKRDGARRIGPYLSTDVNRSNSFVVFAEAVRRLAVEA
ncbi:MAG: DUF4276 family protein [Sulfuritalea sp.]|jgi:hypothetical protein|nr:DUF4276 family protein [Sulfuritalea sp.]